MEYNTIIDKATVIPDLAKRLAYIGVYSTTHFTIAERNCTKPFNPLLGETYEYYNDDM